MRFVSSFEGYTKTGRMQQEMMREECTILIAHSLVLLPCFLWFIQNKVLSRTERIQQEMMIRVYDSHRSLFWLCVFCLPCVTTEFANRGGCTVILVEYLSSSSMLKWLHALFFWNGDWSQEMVLLRFFRRSVSITSENIIRKFVICWRSVQLFSLDIWLHFSWKTDPRDVDDFGSWRSFVIDISLAHANSKSCNVFFEAMDITKKWSVYFFSGPSVIFCIICKLVIPDFKRKLRYSYTHAAVFFRK